MITTLTSTIIKHHKLAFSCEGCMKMARKQEFERKNEAKCKMKYISDKKAHKVIYIRDSHFTGCAAEVKHNLNNKSENGKNLK